MEPLPPIPQWKKRKLANREWYVKQLRPCDDCGAFNEGFMEWHHLDPSQKEANVAFILNNKGRPAALKEIEKCACLCANCHRLRHYNERTGVGKP